MQPSTPSPFTSAVPSSQQAASPAGNTSSFRTVAISLLVDRALAA